MRDFVVGAIGLVLTACWTGSSSAASGTVEHGPGSRRNVVMIVSDDHGLQLGCYGETIIKTPHLDALAAEGTRFANAFCVTASCSPSRSTILTGRFGHATGQYGLAHSYHNFRAMPKQTSLPKLLNEDGVRTAIIGKLHVLPEEMYPFETLPGNARNPVAMADACRKFLAECVESQTPFFLYFCTIDPHRSGDVNESLPERPNRFGNIEGGHKGVVETVYDSDKMVVPPWLPNTPESRAEWAEYAQSVSRVDQGVGRLIEILRQTGAWDNTLVIYLSDNGPAFPGAKTTLYEPGMKLPCIVRDPAAKSTGVVNEGLISWVDLAPTVLEAMGGLTEERAKGFHGRSFLSLVGCDDPQGRDVVYGSHTFHEVTMYFPMRAVREPRFKLIWNLAAPLPFPFASDLYNSATWQAALKAGPDSPYGVRTVAQTMGPRPLFELYDLQTDPLEQRNLADDPAYQQELKRLQDKLRAFQKQTNDPWILKWERE